MNGRRKGYVSANGGEREEKRGTVGGNYGKGNVRAKAAKTDMRGKGAAWEDNYKEREG